jgi:signal peptidase I
MTDVSDPPAVDPAPAPQRRPRLVSQLIEVGVTAAIAVALYLVIQTFLLQTFRVEGRSMQDTLQPEEHLLIDKLTPRFTGYHRGDVVVLHPPDRAEDTTPYIKRVIGEPGDHLEIRDDHVWVNGAELDEGYVNPRYPTEPGEWTTYDVPDGELIVMGDHRNASLDSREFGPVKESEVIGRALLRFWPLDQFGLVLAPSYPGVPMSPAA